MKTNLLYRGDCGRVLTNIANFPDGSVDLIYADPPFFSNRHYEQIWKNPDGSPDEYEMRSFMDHWDSIEDYIRWMEPRLRECHRVLKPTGTMYLHCDWHANARLRILMDSIFTEKNFRNEIVWCYDTAGRSRRMFNRKHDNIYLYTKGPDYVFHQPRIPFVDEGSFGHVDPDGRHYRIRTNSNNGKTYKYYQDEGRGVNDWWTDMPALPQNDRERLGYPTQKPEALLARIINASSDAEAIVLDPFCGCGTAVAVAQSLGRRWIGIDVSPNACLLMEDRMGKLLPPGSPKTPIIGMPKTPADIRMPAMTHYEFQMWVCERLVARPSPKFTGDGGIDGRILHGNQPVAITQKDGVDRVWLDKFVGALNRDGNRKGTAVALSFGSGFRKEVSRLHNLPAGDPNKYEIDWVLADDLLKDQ